MYVKYFIIFCESISNILKMFAHLASNGYYDDDTVYEDTRFENKNTHKTSRVHTIPTQARTLDGFIE